MSAAFDAALVGRAPIGERFSLLAKVGVLSGTAESDVTLTVRGVPLNTESSEDDGSEGIYGLGFAYRFNDRFSVRLMYDRLGTDSGLDTVSLGFVGRF
ncbi:MAG: porin family protein [Gammaproteobacteria bacterium]|nr:porin family protein [Gammaproteobacteria bacterium]